MHQETTTPPDSQAAAAGTILVTGYLGAGKTRVAAALSGGRETGADEGFSGGAAGTAPDGRAIREAGGLETGAESGSALIVAAVDGLNLPALLGNRQIAPLVRAQIASAHCVVLTRGDQVDIAPARRALQGLTDRPVFELHDRTDLLAAVTAAGGAALPAVAAVTAPRFTTWRHASTAVLTRRAVDALLAALPRGTWRLKGRVRAAEGGLDVQVFGAGRMIELVDPPDETRLVATGPADIFAPRDLEIAFAEAVMAASYLRGIIACR